MSKVRDNSAPKMILGVCWGACAEARVRDRSPFLAKPEDVKEPRYIIAKNAMLVFMLNGLNYITVRAVCKVYLW